MSLELAETRQLFTGISYQKEGVISEFYLYEDDQGGQGKFGGRIGYKDDLYHIELDYIESLHDNHAVSIHGHLNIDNLMLIAEHLIIENDTSLSFKDQNQTSQFEVAYQFGLVIISALYQESDALADF